MTYYWIMQIACNYVHIYWFFHRRPSTCTVLWWSITQRLSAWPLYPWQGDLWFEIFCLIRKLIVSFKTTYSCGTLQLKFVLYNSLWRGRWNIFNYGSYFYVQGYKELTALKHLSNRKVYFIFVDARLLLDNTRHWR